MPIFLLVSLFTPVWMVLHTLIGVLFMPIYGVERWRWRAGAIEVQARTRKDGTTRIWFKPGAQTWGLIIFCADSRNYESKSILVHERVHIFQTYLFGVLYPVTWVLSFLVLRIAVMFGAWKNDGSRDNTWRAYKRIPWELWAYWKQRRFDRGECKGAWGSE